MSVERARMLAPQVETGLALSTTHIFGDCRAGEVPVLDACGKSIGACAQERGPLRVLVLPVSQSVPLDPACPKGASIADLTPRAAFDGRSSEVGEAVIPLAPGTYSLHLSHDDQCASCGVSQAEGCLFEVRFGEIQIAPLVLDRAFR